MKKLRLDLDQVEVTTFIVGARVPERGTICAAEWTIDVVACVPGYLTDECYNAR
jgi:hypothetical protein